MQKDKVVMPKNCLSVFVKRDFLDLPDKFFTLANNEECTPDMYMTNYDKPMEPHFKRIAAYYHMDKHRLSLSLESNMSDSKYTTQVYDISICTMKL